MEHEIDRKAEQTKDLKTISRQIKLIPKLNQLNLHFMSSKLEKTK